MEPDLELNPCPACRASMGSFFIRCPACGAPATTPSMLAWNNGRGRIRIVFSRSRYAKFENALTIARRSGILQVSGHEGEPVHQLELPPEDIGLALTLWDLVGQWRGSAMTVDDRPATKRDLVYHALGCFCARRRFDRELDYCHGLESWSENRWGCIRLGFSEGDAEWQTVFAKADDGTWHLNREILRAFILTRALTARQCPVFDVQRAAQTIDDVPDLVSAESDSPWFFLNFLDDTPDSAPSDVPDEDDDSAANDPAGEPEYWEHRETGPGIVAGTRKHYLQFIQDVLQLKRERRHAEVIDLLQRMIEAVVEEARTSGLPYGPWYFEHLAIVYRKEGRLAEEVALLERYVTLTDASGEDTSYGDLARRLDRARALLASATGS